MGAFSKKPYTAEVTQLREEDTSSGRYEGETDFAEEVLSSPKKLFVKVRMIKERDQREQEISESKIKIDLINPVLAQFVRKNV